MSSGDGPAMRVALIDAVNVLRRVYEAMPEQPDAANAAAGSALRGIQRIILHLRPTHAVAVFDGGGPGWRHALYPKYKANRPPAPAAVRDAIDALHRSAGELGLAAARAPGVEADDLIASIAASLTPRGVDVVVVSTDRGFAQLLGPRLRLYDHASGSFRDAAWAEQHFGVAPARVAELLALAGNPTDNLPGIPGIGPKTAARLLREHGTLQGVMNAAATLAGRTGERLREHAESVQLWLQLARLRSDLALGLTLADARLPAQLSTDGGERVHGE